MNSESVLSSDPSRMSESSTSIGTVKQLAKQFESLIKRTTISRQTAPPTGKLVVTPSSSAATNTTTVDPPTPSINSNDINTNNITSDTHKNQSITTTHKPDITNTPTQIDTNQLVVSPATSLHQSRRSITPCIVQQWSCSELFNRLSGFGSLLCVDTRSVNDYNNGHIPRALNIPLTECTTLTLNDIDSAIQSAADKRIFKCRARQTVVVYGNDNSDNLSSLLCNTLVLENRVLCCAVLNGGYNQFHTSYPYAICNNSTVPQSHMSLPNALDIEPMSPLKTSSTLHTPITSPIRTQSTDLNSPGSALKSMNKHMHRPAFPWYPSEILVNQLYLGSHTDACNLDTLTQLDITHILNVSAEVDNMYPQQFTYKHIVLPDLPDSDITAYFDMSNQYIDLCMHTSGKCLVHCYQGVSRSSTLIIAYLMYSQHMSLVTAYHHVLNARKQIMPNIGFWQQLGLYECKLYNISHSTINECIDIAAMELENSMKTIPSADQSNDRSPLNISASADVHTVG